MTAAVKDQIEKQSLKTLGILAGATLLSAIVFKGLYNLSSSSNTEA